MSSGPAAAPGSTPWMPVLHTAETRCLLLKKDPKPRDTNRGGDLGFRRYLPEFNRYMLSIRCSPGGRRKVPLDQGDLHP